MIESEPGSDVRQKDILSRRARPVPRFDAIERATSGASLWLVQDHLLQITIFHWYGNSGEKKARAVAEALEQLKDED